MFLFDIHCRGHLSNFITPSIILEINAKRLKSIVMSLSIFASLFPSFVTFLFATKIFFSVLSRTSQIPPKKPTKLIHTLYLSHLWQQRLRGVKNINRHSNNNKLQQTINKWAKLKNNKEVRDSKLVCANMGRCRSAWKCEKDFLNVLIFHASYY